MRHGGNCLDFERESYQRMLELLDAESVLFVTSLDRLGRNYKEIMLQWKAITQEKGADIVVLGMPLLDTRERRDRAETAESTDNDFRKSY